ncbi:aspartate--tRNA ligase [Candidatus Marinamargulisbacteria bacterium SCGC AG-439-L15]|nr:aspartate--tRNA ligase [Candidatus Marinamargulisbacteria bacterium SCGC AG-439-L15]
METPVLTKSTPEGARDYLVPSRHHLGKVYALPQSPQLFKQLLMVSGMERYYQIVKCFRDEDLRPNRQPEFTQLDLEASFIDEDFIIDLIEGLLVSVFKTEDITLNSPFLQINYEEAMDRFGSDKPDLRPGMEMVTVTDIFKDCGYKIFSGIVKNGGLIKAIVLKNKADQLSKNMLQNDWAGKVIQKLGGKGLTWMKLENGALQSNIVQFFTQEQQDELVKTVGAEDNDVIFMVADTNHHTVKDVMGRFRLFVAKELGLSDPDTFIPCWVTNFPLFELKDGNVSSMHHPFTQPDRDLPSKDDKEALLKVNSRAYDIAVNGEELGGGSIRIHDTTVQKQIFELLGLSESEIEQKFGFFNKALTYGTPPHGGIALGIDRLVAMVLKTDSIREVIAFPKNRVAHCPLTQAPSLPDQAQLDELNLSIHPEEEQ